jgi:hypothetical protein
LQVDGRGNSLLDFDDPNLPSLLAMPLLGFDDYDTEVSIALDVQIRSHMVCGDVHFAFFLDLLLHMCVLETHDYIVSAFRAPALTAGRCWGLLIQS